MRRAVSQEVADLLKTSALIKGEDSALLSGAPLRALLLFALPIITGNIFQQLYNIVDAVVVGRFLGELPLAGISVASPIMDLANALIIGGSLGVGILTGQLCGAGETERLKALHASALLGGFVLTGLLALLGGFCSDDLLRAQGTDAAVCQEASCYLRIIFLGLVFCFLYNYYASQLRACGNSRTPFVILLVSSSLHALLDLLLVGRLGLGIGGAAFSTVACQAFSAIWCIVYTTRHCAPLRLLPGELRFSPAAGRSALSFCWAAALQQAVICLGRMLIQGMLTPLGTDAVTGYNMGLRAEIFLFCFSQGISASMVVCLSQNLGRGDYARVRRFFMLGLKVNLFLGLGLALLCALFPGQIIGIFTDSEAVITSGALYTGTMAFFYIPSFIGEILQGFFRGIGRLRLTMLASFGQMALRVLLSWLLIPIWGIPGICAAIITGWLLLVILEGWYALRVSSRLGCQNT